MQGNDRLCGADGNDRIYGSVGRRLPRRWTRYRRLARRQRQARHVPERRTARRMRARRDDNSAPDDHTPNHRAHHHQHPATTAAPTTTDHRRRRRHLRPAGSPPCRSERLLPTEQQCATRVRRMTENRPENATYNATRGTSPNDEFPACDRQLHRHDRRDPPMGGVQVGHRRGPRPGPDRPRIVVDDDERRRQRRVVRPRPGSRSVSRQRIRGRQRQAVVGVQRRLHVPDLA